MQPVIDDVTHLRHTLNDMTQTIDPLRMKTVEFEQDIQKLKQVLRAASLDKPMGRWVWTSRATLTNVIDLRKHDVVPWNVQSINTTPDLISWYPNQGTIVIKRPGLYLLTMAFFTQCRPSVMVLVNGVAVLAPVCTASTLFIEPDEVGTSGGGDRAQAPARRRRPRIRESSQSSEDDVDDDTSSMVSDVTPLTCRHPNGNVSGLCCSEYVVLPPDAELCISFECPSPMDSDGFMSILKI